ncbi:MAG: mandelate racemase/muconate lactonizing enzyme family protein [Desulfatiglandales bacterium]
MKIDQIRLFNVSIPLAFSFSHAVKDRSAAENIVVEILGDRNYIRGYGEGAPRTYVTGESQEKAARDLGVILPEGRFPWDLEEVGQIWDFVDSLPREKSYHSLICALEMALLDALGRQQRRPIADYFPHTFYHDTVSYGAVVPLASPQRVMDFCLRTAELGIKRLKLKLGRNVEQSRAALKAVALVLGNDYELTIDANMAWDYGMAMSHLPLLKSFKVRVVEQPTATEDPDIPRLASAMNEQGILLMADESACCIQDLSWIGREDVYQMINIRLSKCGGFKRSMEMIEYLRSRGVAFQIGCHVGESGILSAAGRTLSTLCSDAACHEGSYDAFLLQENITSEDVTFGREGKASALVGSGLGLDIDPRRVLRWSGGKPALTISRSC